MISWNQRDESSDYSNKTLSDYNDPLSENKLHYIFIDGNGNKLSSEYTVDAAFSDCRPIYNGSEIVFYASDSNTIDFYTINASTGDFNKKVCKNLGDNVSWEYNNGVLTISGTGEMKILSSNNWSSSSAWPSDIRKNTTKIIVKNGVTKISDNAFADFDKLKEVDIKPGLKSIGKQAFYECGNLEKVTIPSSVTEIGEDIIWTGYWWIGSNAHVYDATIYTSPGSTADNYAKKYYINCSYSTVGDVNNDGKIDSKDAVIVLKSYAESLVNSNAPTSLSGDVNGDDKVDSKDAVIILKYYAATLTGFGGDISEFI